MQISVSSYSFSGFASDVAQVDLVRKAKAMGFAGIEFTEISGSNQQEVLENAKRIREVAEQEGMPIVAYAIGANLYHDTPDACEAAVASICNQVDVAEILGAPVMRHDVCYKLGKTGNSRSFDLMLPTIAENARRITAYAQEKGIRTCTENHGYIAQDSDRIERLFNAVNHDNYGVLVDIGNFVCVDEDPARAVSRVAPYAIHAHAKDMFVRKARMGHCAASTRGGQYFGGAVIGEGDVPVKQCLQILKRVGYDGWLTVEYEGTEGESGLLRGRSNLEAILAQL